MCPFTSLSHECDLDLAHLMHPTQHAHPQARSPSPHTPPALPHHSHPHRPRPRAASLRAHWEALDRVPNDPPDAQDQAPAVAPRALEVNDLPGFYGVRFHKLGPAGYEVVTDAQTVVGPEASECT